MTEDAGTLVLVVEDHPSNRYVLTTQLAALGYPSETASDGAEAMRLWRSGRYALLITDWRMPGMDGWELAVAVRNMETDGGTASRGRIPIIAYTAITPAEIRERCDASGIDDVLSKPVELADLARCMQRWLPVPSDTSSPPTATPAAPRKERAPDTAPDELIDSAALRKVAGEDKSAQAQFIVRFRNTNNDDLDLLERALSQADFTTAGRAAHRIRGAAVLLGLGPLAEAAAELETATLDSRAEVCAQAQARLLRTVQTLYRHFDACYHSRGEA